MSVDGYGHSASHGALTGLANDDHPQYEERGIWTPFTPTFVNATATITVARYAKVGEVCHVYYLLSDFNPTGSWSKVTVPLPFDVDFPSYHPLNGSAYVYDASADAAYHRIIERHSNLNQVGFLSTSGAATRVGTGVPFTWAATGDGLRASFSYPVER